MSADEKKTALRVGVFLALSVAVTMFAVFTLGSNGGIFASKSTLYVHFADINGLVPGAPVRLAGLDVGNVRKITFSDDLEQREARIELSIRDRFMSRIRADSRAFIDSKGLLGDKLVNITIGNPKSPPLHDGDTLKTRTSPSIEQLTNKVNDAVTSITRATDEAGLFLETLADPELRADLKRMLHSAADIAEGVQQSDSVAHRLIYDKRYADEIGGILEETRRTMSGLRAAVEHVQAVASAVRSGDGTLHELVYGRGGVQTLTDLQRAAFELGTLVQAVRTEPGLLHTLIYDEKSGEILQQWAELSERVNRISRSVEQGRGTIGALLIDPSVYEDVKTVLGNIERNVLFKALIRFTIKEDGIKRPALMPRKQGTGETRATNH
jgi:phospholipid/cholesterol/gamma-HCH transport system substrate-binding protein